MSILNIDVSNYLSGDQKEIVNIRPAEEKLASMPLARAETTGRVINASDSDLRDVSIAATISSDKDDPDEL